MIDAELIARARDFDIVSTAERLGASLKRATATERVGPCPKCGGRDRFAVNVKRRVWHCRGCAKGGAGALSLVMHVRALNLRESVAFLAGNMTPTPARVRPAADPKDDAFLRRLIADIVGKLGPIRGTPGEQYFSSIRKIDTDAIADVLERTDAIGWHPSVLFREKGHALDGRRLGCIVGIMTDPVTAMPTGAISRTYLTPDLVKVGKAKTLGTPTGIVRLSRDEDVGAGLHLAEGLETGVDALAKGFRPTWSTGSTSLMASFPVLPGVEALTLFADNDFSGAGLRAAIPAAARWRAAGRETHVYLRNTIGDLNDAFRELDR
jgi:putative DNA primase/helicase